MTEPEKATKKRKPRAKKAPAHKGGAMSDENGNVHDHDSIRFITRTGVRYGGLAEVGYFLTMTDGSTDVRRNETG